MARLKCQKCGSVFDGRSDAKYCSGVCRANAAKERAQSRNQAQRGGAGRRSTAMTAAVTRAIKKAPGLTAADTAAAALARRLAREIDAAGAEMVARLSPRLLEVLVQLGMTPKARAGGGAETAPGGTSDRQPTALDEIRARRAARMHRAASVDPAAR